MKKLLLSLGVLLSLSLSLAGCNDDNAKSQGDDGSEPDFLVDVISGEVLENPEGDGVILELELSPKTVFIVARPSLDSGTINTEDFLEKILDVILGIVPLNAVLILTDEDGIAEAVPLVLNGGEFDRATVGTQFDVTPLDPDTNSGQPTNAAEGSPLPSGQTTFGQALLFIGIGPPGHLSKIAMSDTPDTMLSLLSALKATQ